MGIFDRLFDRKGGEEGGPSKVKPPRLVSKTQKPGGTYEVYRGTDAESAKAFLLTKRVKSAFGLQAVARGMADNMIAKVQCGSCEHEWMDAVRYQNVTVVRCPKCKMLNKVDSGNIHSLFI